MGNNPGKLYIKSRKTLPWRIRWMEAMNVRPKNKWWYFVIPVEISSVSTSSAMRDISFLEFPVPTRFKNIKSQKGDLDHLVMGGRVSWAKGEKQVEGTGTGLLQTFREALGSWQSLQAGASEASQKPGMGKDWLHHLRVEVKCRCRLLVWDAIRWRRWQSRSVGPKFRGFLM